MFKLYLVHIKHRIDGEIVSSLISRDNRHQAEGALIVDVGDEWVIVKSVLECDTTEYIEESLRRQLGA